MKNDTLDSGTFSQNDLENPNETEDDGSDLTRDSDQREETIKCDRYGFLVSDQNRQGREVLPNVKTKRLHIESSRTKKWLKMLGDWERYVARKPQKVKRRIRKGVPDSLRGLVWNVISGIKTLKSENPELYTQLCARNDSPSASVHDTIEADIHRTFPLHVMFRELGSSGQLCLRRILHAYSRYDSEVGYCQGMGFVTATFLMYMPEEDAFWQLVAVMNRDPTNLRGLYLPGLPLARQAMHVFEGLIKIHEKKLYRHFVQENIAPSMFSQNWLMCLFTYNFSFDMVTRLWDVFLFEGWKIVYRTGLSILHATETHLIQKEFETCLMFFRTTLPSLIDGARVFQDSFKIPLKIKDIQNLEKEFQQMEGPNGSRK